MTRIDFYVLQPGAQGNRYALAARVTEKAWKAGRRVLIATASEDEKKHMNRLLWTYREQSFIPHGLLGQADPALNPVLIGTEQEAGEEHDVLVNLCLRVPEYFSRFERVLECVDHDEQVIASGREHYRYYQKFGYPLHLHRIN